MMHWVPYPVPLKPKEIGTKEIVIFRSIGQSLFKRKAVRTILSA